MNYFVSQAGVARSTPGKRLPADAQIIAPGSKPDVARLLMDELSKVGLQVSTPFDETASENSVIGALADTGCLLLVLPEQSDTSIDERYLAYVQAVKRRGVKNFVVVCLGADDGAWSLLRSLNEQKDRLVIAVTKHAQRQAIEAIYPPSNGMIDAMAVVGRFGWASAVANAVAKQLKKA